MDMNLKQIKYVILLSEEGSFSRAAEILNISQPSLSQYIKNIESQIGLTLFERINCEVKLTDAGKIYVETGKKILDLENKMESDFSELNNFMSGTITIGISPYRSSHMVPRLLKEFDKLYPNVKLVIKEKSGHDLIGCAERGEFDLCIIALPVDKKTFNCEVVQKEELVIAVNNGTDLYRELDKKSVKDSKKDFPAVDIKSVGGQQFAMLSEYMPIRILTKDILDMYNVQVVEKIEVSSNEALLAVVESGVCSAFVPSGIVSPSRSNISYFSIKQTSPYREIGVIYKKDKILSKPMEDVISILKKGV